MSHFTHTTTLQIHLIDFGASRSYSKSFTNEYIKVIDDRAEGLTRYGAFVQVIHGAAIGNRDQVLQSSINLGFLTGFEDKVS